MNLDTFCADLGLDRTFHEEIAPAWDALTEDWTGGTPFFLAEDFFEENCPGCGGPPVEELRPGVRRVLGIVGTLPAAALLGHILYRGSFLLSPAVTFRSLPEELPCFGRDTGLFSLLVSLGAIPLMVKACETRGIPVEYAYAAKKWIGGTMIQYATGHDGAPGRALQFNWIRNYVDGKLFRIGRLEFLMHSCPDWLPAVYRNAEGRLRVLCRDGWGFRSDGSRTEDPALVVRRTRLKSDGMTVTGTPVAPDGTVGFDRETTLDLKSWSPLVSPWDLCPSIHIPGGEPMPFEAVKSSLMQAKEFFRRYFGRHVPLFCCASWILNPAWEELMPRSNMAAFRRECRALCSLYWGPSAGMIFLFGRKDVSPLELPARNTAQRAFQQAFRENRIVAGSLLVAADDVEKLGNGYYRRQGDD